VKKFKCNCDFHIIEVDNTPLKGEDYIGITIYNNRSEQTGTEFKKPKEMGTVVLIGEEARQFVKYLTREIE
jgi:hypothetical protein